MKTNNFFLLSTLSLIIIFTSISCRKWEEPGGGGTGGGGNKPSVYKLSGMFRDYTKLDGCRWVFETKDAKKYEVAKFPERPGIKADVPATIEMQYSSASASVCMVGPIIDVLSITYANTPEQVNCKMPVKILSGGNNQTVTVQKAAQNGNYLKMLLGYSGCNFDAKPINLFWDGNISKTNPASITVRLINQPAPQNCEAYFTAETCFDLSPFKNLGKTLLINIEGYKDGPVTVSFR